MWNESDKTHLILRMGDSEMSGFSSSNSRSDGSSWEVDTIDWDYESDETNLKRIFHDSVGMDDDDVSMKEEENIDIVINAESIIENQPKIESLDTTHGDGIDFQGRIPFEGVWWNSSGA